MHFRNLKIGSKLFIGYAIVFIATISISVVSLINFDKVTKQSNDVFNLVTTPLAHLVKFSVPYGNLRSAMRDLGNATKEEENETLITSIQTYFSTIETESSAYLAEIKGNQEVSPEEIEAIQKIVDALVVYKEIVNTKLIPAGRNNQNDMVKSIISNDLKASGVIIREQIAFLTEQNIGQSYKTVEEANKMSTTIKIVILSLLIVSLFISAILAALIIKSITRPIRELVKAVGLMAEGNLNINIRVGAKDEVGNLSKDFSKLVATLSEVIDSLAMMCKEHEEGRIGSFIDEDRFQGEFKNVANRINQMTKNHITTTNEVVACITEIVNGDFDAKIPQLPGEKVFLNEAVEKLRSSILEIDHEIAVLVNAAVSGNLSQRADLSKYKGDWLRIIGGLNNVLDAVVYPIQETSAALEEMSKGHLNSKIAGDYKGDFLLVKDSFNHTTEAIGSYINEINRVLGELSVNNFDTGITREYIGEFSSIKNSLNMIIDKLSSVLGKINETSLEVADGSKRMSQTSASLAAGASLQAGSVEELNAAIDLVREQTNKNAQNAQKANEISTKSTKNAIQGDKDMENMLVSMENIRDSSNNISKIIKVIDDIAFQTNLLALNAAVEAARAGVHGKGFAVVAEEVRNLAGRSQKAAQETTTLIEESISCVSDGTNIANATAKSLKLIVEDVKLISNLVEEIAASSTEQDGAISQINSGISQIAQVIQNNSETSEESSETARSLYEQSESLQAMISVFKLKHSR